MSMLDAFFNKGFKAVKCKTLLKLTMPRIKLLRNRREIQIKQMHRDIAKLLETGQEATARIRVEHVIREENMMAAQEIVELFCELISVRLPIIEAQRECPLDLKEAISSVCFAAPRCADLPELLQVQILFAAKYGKEFVSAASELAPDCGVNRQLIELLSIRAPAPDMKLRILKGIAEEHELDWDPTASETEFFKTHEDLLNGPTQFVSGSKLPLPRQTIDESLHEQSNSDLSFDLSEFPKVPEFSIHPQASRESTDQPEPNSPLAPKDVSHERPETPAFENKQFVPFISLPSPSHPPLFPSEQSGSPCPVSEVRDEHPAAETSPPIVGPTSEGCVDLHDVLAAAHAAAESAERAAVAARSAASLAELRITEIAKKDGRDTENGSENPFGAGGHDHLVQTSVDHPNMSYGSSDDRAPGMVSSSLPCDPKVDHGSAHRQPQRLASMDDDVYFSYPNLFRAQSSNLGPDIQSDTDAHKF